MTISNLFASLRAADRAQLILVSTTLTSFFTGFLLGVYSIRGYLISPELVKERQANYKDPVESEESDVDEDDTILDHAPNWSNGEEADRKQGLRVKAVPKEVIKKEVVKEAQEVKKEAVKENEIKEQELGNPGEECKLVLVVRTDLGMTKGKIAAQCGHATLACYKSLVSDAQRRPAGAAAKLLRRWEQRGQAKIAVQIKDQDEMLELMGKARSLGVTAEVIADAGRTQIDPGSLTVLGVGPAPKSVVDRITGHLKLL